MKKIKQFLYWTQQTRPIYKSFIAGTVLVPIHLTIRFIVDTEGFINAIPHEITLAIAFGIGLGFFVLVHSLLFPDKRKQGDNTQYDNHE